MAIITRVVEYKHEGRPFEGLLALDDAGAAPRPCVLIFHAWDGRSESQDACARKLADWGYAAFAVDLYGKGLRGTTTQECQALMTPLVQDRAMLRVRLLNAVEVVKGLPDVDSSNLAAIGFCFGGLCVLDLARAGAEVKGVASIHGLFTPPGLPVASPMKTKVIAFHGWDDPMAPPDALVGLGKELTAAGADWQVHAYGGTVHGFTNEAANMPEMGIVYNARSARRAWEALRNFLAETLGGAEQ